MKNKTHRHHPSRFESLEARELMAADAASFKFSVDSSNELHLVAERTGADIAIFQWGNLLSITDRATGKVTRLPSNLTGITFKGGEGDDWISNSSSLKMTARGGAGDDSIRGGWSDDQIFGDTGNDTLHGGSGDDSLHGGVGRDAIFGDSGNDQIDGGSGEDDLRGGSGNDLIKGQDGNDSIDGNEGHDRLFGNNGDDTIAGGSGVDFIYGHLGNDRLFGGDDADFIFGYDGNDHIEGNSGKDMLFGGDGDDNIWGGDGVDLIFGENGNDNLYDYERFGSTNCILFCWHSDTILGGDGTDRENGAIMREDKSPSGSTQQSWDSATFYAQRVQTGAIPFTTSSSNIVKTIQNPERLAGNFNVVVHYGNRTERLAPGATTTQFAGARLSDLVLILEPVDDYAWDQSSYIRQYTLSVQYV